MNSLTTTKLRYINHRSEMNSWIHHILPSLVNLQGDDQLNGANKKGPVRTSEDHCPRDSVSPHLHLFHLRLFPHMSRTTVLV